MIIIKVIDKTLIGILIIMFIGLIFMSNNKAHAAETTSPSKYTLTYKYKSGSKTLKTKKVKVKVGKKVTAKYKKISGYTIKGAKSKKVTMNKNKTVTFKYKAKKAKSVKSIVNSVIASYGWSKQKGYIHEIIAYESGWNPNARNGIYYGLGQLGTERSSNPKTQAKNIMRYIKSRYGTPLKAVQHKRSYGWY